MISLFPVPALASTRRGRRRKTGPRLPLAADLWQAFTAPAAVPAPKRKPKAKATAAPKIRAPLGETVQRLKTPAPASAPRPPRGASFRGRVHAGPEGTRGYKLYVPASGRGAEEPMPLVVMLHGCTQTPEDFARGTRMNALAEELRFLVAYPGQPREAHRGRCWNWYLPPHQGRGAGEPELIAGIVRDLLATQPVDPRRVYVAGLSAGACAALVLGARYPDLFAAVGAHSGMPVGAAHDLGSSLVAARYGAPGDRPALAIPTIVFHGEADPVVNARNGRYIALRAIAPYPGLTASVRTGRVPGGRGYVRTVHRVGRGRPVAEHWLIQGSGHGWSGGHPAGSFTDPAGPDASREMLRFFLRHRLARPRRRPGAGPCEPGAKGAS
ncbi:MAG: PHB depolymerase family esterase [Amaricoccus sp.]